MATELSLHEKLVDMQNRLKVPKDDYNSFSGFHFRNIEGIQEKVKPLLKEHNCTLTFVDDVVAIEGRVYVKSTAILSDGSDKTIQVPGFARESLSKTKWDEAQLTGSSSSYARKYAAGGLFLIDDNKDPDAHDNTKVAQKKEVAKPVVTDTPKNSELAVAKNELNKMFDTYGYDNPVKKKVFINQVLDKNTVDTIDEAEQLMAELTSVGANNEN